MIYLTLFNFSGKKKKKKKVRVPTNGIFVLFFGFFLNA